MTDPKRRDDDISDKIDDLIVAATDPKDKALLLILNKIAKNLDENTGLTRNLSASFKDHTDAFAKHEKDEMALINQGRGFWRATAIAVVVLQGIGLYFVQDTVSRIGKTEEALQALRVDMATHKEHHQQEERYREGPKVRP